jgi:hypothetical protein
MHVVLIIQNGPLRGQKRSMHAGQMLDVGRSEDADLPCPHDTSLSRIHFRLETDTVGCYLKDLGSSNGTRVNRKPVDRTLLQDWDVVDAGGTQFQVRIRGDDRESAFASLNASVDYTDNADVVRARQGRLQAEFTSETCESGIVLFRGEVAVQSAATMAEALRTSGLSLLLCVDGRRMDAPPETLGEAPAYLFDWLPP